MSTDATEILDDQVKNFEQSLVDLRYRMGSAGSASFLGRDTSAFNQDLKTARDEFERLKAVKNDYGDDLLEPADIRRLSEILADLAEEYEDLSHGRLFDE